MTLVITLLAAIVATIVWYALLPKTTYHIGTLALMYWGAVLMWSVDGIASLLEGEGFIEIVDTAAMIDDALLGGIVVIAGLGIWALYLIIKDPKGALKSAFSK
ncbi:MAG: hypothetical protein IJV62_04875 [Eggerthellaceae bacterium]|nr:hypothetical protein [Eggerthellaceae bacterium]